MKRGTVRLAHPGESRNVHQSVTLLEAIEEFRFDALIGGARRDEEKARAKERIFSHRDSFGQWQPKDQRPELWTLFNTRLAPGEHFRVFPISNWTELDVWQYIEREHIALPSIYYTHKREVVERRGLLVPVTELTPPRDGEAGRGARRALPHRGRHHLHLPGRQPGGRRRRRGARDAGGRRQRTRRHAHGRQDLRSLHGKTQERRVLLMSATARPLATRTASQRPRPNDRRRPALHHLRQRRRRQEHAHRPPAGRQQDRAAGPAGRRAARRRDRPGAADRRPVGRARTGHHDRRGLPLLLDRASRKFIIGDAPGHEQYTRNMVTAASSADAAVVLVDATKLAWAAEVGDGEVVRRELLPQTRRHTLLCHLLRVQSIVFAVNKLDAIDDAELAFERISQALRDLRRSGGRAGRRHRCRSRRSRAGTWRRATPTGPATKARACSNCSSSCRSPRRTSPCPSPSRCSGSRSSRPRPTPRRAAACSGAASPAATSSPASASPCCRATRRATVAQVLSHTRQPKAVHAGHSAGIVLDRELDVSRGDWLLAPGRLRAGARDHRHRGLARRRAAGGRAASTGRCRATAGSRPRWRASSTA